MSVWFITSASRAFGLQLTTAALAAGDQVVATARASTDRLVALPLDVTVEDQDTAAVVAAVKHFQRIDVVANNTGYGVFGSIEEIPAEDVRALFDTNVLSPTSSCAAPRTPARSATWACPRSPWRRSRRPRSSSPSPRCRTSTASATWLLHHAENILLIPGTSSVAHLEQNLTTADLDLTAEQMQTLDALDPIS